MRLACDLSIASTTASFGCPEVRNAILHGYGAMRLVQMIPFAVAMDMLLTGNRLDAQRAYDVGLVSPLVSTGANSCRSALKLAETVAINAPLSVKLTKELAWRGLHDHPARVHELCQRRRSRFSTLARTAKRGRWPSPRSVLPSTRIVDGKHTHIPLDPLLYPQSIVVIGASSEARKAGGRRWLSVIEAGFGGRIIRSISKTQKTLNGYSTFQDLKQVEEPIELAVIMVPTPAVLDTVEDAPQAGQICRTHIGRLRRNWRRGTGLGGKADGHP